MATNPGTVDRTLLQSYYQSPGQVYDDAKTEGAFEVLASQNDANWNAVSGWISSSFVSRVGLINIKDYGAVGDGIADDTAALTAAITALGTKGEIFFPYGTYNIASFVNVPEDIVLISNGRASLNGPIRVHKVERMTFNSVFIANRNDVIYNKTKLDKVKQALATASTSVVNVDVLGDSIVFGQVSTDEQHKSWAGLLRRYLTERFGNAGFGYYFGGAANTEYKEGTNLKTYKLDPAATNFSAGTMRFKDLEIIKGKNTDGGTFNIAIDGVNYPVSSAGTGREYGVHETIYTSPEAKDHLVQVFKPASGVGYFEGFVLKNDTKGVMVHQIGHVGVRGGEYDANSATASVSAFSPKLTVIGFGMNDFIQQTSVAAYKTGMELLIQKAQLNGGVTVLLNYQDTNDGGSPITLSGHYKKAMLELAGQYGCVFVDIDKKWIDNATKVTNGFGVAFDPHPYDAGHQDIFDTFRELFDGIKSPDRTFKPAFLNSAGESANDRSREIVKVYENVNFSGAAKIGNERFRRDADLNGVADEFTVIAAGDNTGNSSTPTLTANGQKLVVNKTNSPFSVYRLSKAFTGLTVGNDYLIYVKYLNATPAASLELLDDFTNSTLVTSKSSVSDLVAVKRTAAKTNPTIYFNKSQDTIATHNMEFSGVGVYDLTYIKNNLGIDLSGYTAEDAARIIDESLSKRLNGAAKKMLLTDSTTGDIYAITVNSGTITATKE